MPFKRRDEVEMLEDFRLNVEAAEFFRPLKFLKLFQTWKQLLR